MLPLPAAQRACSDWEKGTARFLVMGLLRSDTPWLDRDSGLYYSSLGCGVDRASTAYLHEYNAQIRALMREVGRPEWAPGSRLPDRQRLLELMSDAHPVTTQEALEALQLRSLGHAFQPFDLVPAVAYRRMEDVGLLLLGSDVTAMLGRIDVLDLREKRWMVSEEFDRRQVGMLPWDRLPRDAKDAIRARHAAATAALAQEHARIRAKQEARGRLAEVNRQRCAELVEEMKKRDFACPHCHEGTRFRYLPKSACFVCLKCGRSSTALAFDKHA